MVRVEVIQEKFEPGTLGKVAVIAQVKIFEDDRLIKVITAHPTDHIILGIGGWSGVRLVEESIPVIEAEVSLDQHPFADKDNDL